MALAAEGCRVAIADRAARDRIDEVAGAVAASGGQAFSAHVDVADEAQVTAMFAKVLPRLGGLDILVSNAGILIEKPLLDTSAADFDRLIGVNLRGVFLVGREAIRVMTRQRKGRVINIASELAYLGRENCSVYCASKGGVLSMTRSWARAFRPEHPGQCHRTRADRHGHAGRRLHLARGAGQGGAEPAGAHRAAGGDRGGSGVPWPARAPPS